MNKLASILYLIVISSIYSESGIMISPKEAINHIGEYKTVKGMVVSGKYLSRVKGRPTFLNLGEAYPNQVFTVVIWGDTRDQFEEDPEYFYRGKNITVSGIIIEYKGIAEIIANDESQITVIDQESK